MRCTNKCSSLFNTALSMKKISILICFLSIGFHVLSQRTVNDNIATTSNSGYEIIVTTGVGTYSMSDLKEVQKLIIDNSEIPLQVTSSFPAYFNYSIRLGHKSNIASQGITAGLMSTGSRSSLADYSGYVYSDINCQAIYMGYYYQRGFYGASFFRQYIAFGYNVNLSFIGSGVDMNDKLILYDNAPENDDFVQTNKNTFNALGIYTDPSLYARYMFSKRFGIELNVGGAISFSTPLYFDKVKNYITVYDEKRFVNWSGVRLSVGIVCKL